MLPSFLEPASTSDALGPYPYIVRYIHSERLGRSAAHCLWWPSKNNADTSTVLLFVPGNPGLADFYKQYLSYIYEAAPDSLAILAHSLIGHSPYVAAPPLSHCSLDAQIEGIIEVIDNIEVSFGPTAKIVLIGHSVGSWIVFRALKECSDRITAAFLLFPTIADIARSPNGSRLSWIFNESVMHSLAIMSRVLRVVPKGILSLLFRDWPADQVQVLWSFLNSPPAILASLTMARQEMDTIKDLDRGLLNDVKHKLYFFFAEMDDWVGTSKATILREMNDEPHSVRVVQGRHGIPHAYCINHGKELGEQSLKWLQDDIFSLTARIVVIHK